MLPLWILLLCFYCGGVHSTLHTPHSQNLQVKHGQSVILPCNGSSYLEDDWAIQWEAMGEDVITLQGEELQVGDRFRDRVHFAHEEKINEGDWSVVLEPLRFSDTNMYECIWKGRRTLSVVWLTVTSPEVEDSIVASVGDDVILRCYNEVSRFQSTADLVVWWERNNTMLIEKKEEFVHSESDFVEYPPMSIQLIDQMDFSETFHILMRLNTVDDSGEYRCWYKTRESDDPIPGMPASITVTVLEPNHEETGFETTTHFETATETLTETTTVLMPVLLDDATQPLEVITEPQLMEAFDETVTSFPDDHSPETSSESLQWDAFPWVRTGLIAGVLLATAVVLCILRALQKV